MQTQICSHIVTATECAQSTEPHGLAATRLLPERWGGRGGTHERRTDGLSRSEGEEGKEDDNITGMGWDIGGPECIPGTKVHEVYPDTIHSDEAGAGCAMVRLGSGTEGPLRPLRSSDKEPGPLNPTEKQGRECGPAQSSPSQGAHRFSLKSLIMPTAVLSRRRRRRCRCRPGTLLVLLKVSVLRLWNECEC